MGISEMVTPIMLDELDENWGGVGAMIFYILAFLRPLSI